MNIASSTAAGTATLQLEYLSAAQVASQSPSWWHSVLGVVGFEKPPSINRTRVPVTASMTRSLGADDICEVWRVAGPTVNWPAAVRRRTACTIVIATICCSDR